MKKKAKKQLKRTFRNIKKRRNTLHLERLTVEHLMENYEREDLRLLVRHCHTTGAHAFYERDIPIILEEQRAITEKLRKEAADEQSDSG